MLKIEEDTIYLTRGDKATLTLNIEDYTFNQGDKISFRVYKNYGFNKLPVLEKLINITQSQENVDIVLNPEDTKLNGILNNPIEFWYEVELNNEYTVIGYNKEGAAKLILLPEGVEENES